MDSSRTDVIYIQTKFVELSNLRRKIAFSTNFDSWFVYCVLSEQNALSSELYLEVFDNQSFQFLSKFTFSFQFFVGLPSVNSFVIKLTKKFSWSKNCKTFSIVQKLQKRQTRTKPPLQ